MSVALRDVKHVNFDGVCVGGLNISICLRYRDRANVLIFQVLRFYVRYVLYAVLKRISHRYMLFKLFGKGVVHRLI